MEYTSSAAGSPINEERVKQQTVQVILNDLPEDILVEIFARLEAKSVGKCRCLSKFWSERLSTTQFIQKHLITRQRALHKRENIIFCSENVRNSPDRTGFGFSIISSPVQVEEVSRRVELRNGAIQFWGSCDGIVLLSTSSTSCWIIPRIKTFFLINPITLKQLDIPHSGLEASQFSAKDKLKLGDVFGFGYDRVSDDYKMVSVSNYLYTVNSTFDSSHTLLRVYSVKNGAWKIVQDMSGLKLRFYNVVPGAFVKESMHWFSFTNYRRSVIVAFDLASESLRAISFPTEFDGRKVNMSTEIYVLDGCLCVLEKLNDSSIFNLWIMKEYGVVDSWCCIRIRTDSLPDIHSSFCGGLLCFVGDEKVLGVTMGCTWSVFDLKKVTAKKVSPGVAICFIDSLINPEQLVSKAGKKPVEVNDLF